MTPTNDISKKPKNVNTSAEHVNQINISPTNVVGEIK